MMENKDSFRDSLHEAEKPWYDIFLQSMGRKPECMWELMCWSASRQYQNQGTGGIMFGGLW